MKTKNTLKKALVAICVLALLVSVLPASVFAEETIEIPEENYLYVNGDSKVLKAEEEMAFLRLVVEDPGKFHILASGVDITLVLFDEGQDEVIDVYSSKNGLMDVPFYAAPGRFLLGITGNGEVEILVVDEAGKDAIYSGEKAAEVAAEAPAEEPAEAPAEEPAEAPAEEPAEAPAEEPAEAPAEEPAEVPAEEPAEVPAEEPAEVPAEEPAEVPAEAPAEEPAETPADDNQGFFTGFVNWLTGTPSAEIVEAPAEEPAEAPAEEPAEVPAEEPAEVSAEEPAEVSAEEPAEAPAEEPAEVPAEEPAEAPAEVPAEEPAEVPDEQALFEARYANEIALYRQFGQWADLSSVPYEDILRIKEFVDGPEAEPAEEPAEVPAEEPAEVPAEEPAEVPAEEPAEVPAEEPAEAPAEVPAEEPAEIPDEQALFEARYANEIALYRQFGQWADLSNVPYEDVLRIKELVDGPKVEPAEEEIVEESVEASAPVTEVTIAIERSEGDTVRLFTEEDLGEGYLYQWQYSLDGEEWLDIDGATNSDYIFNLDNTNGRYYWRLIVSEK